jgi:poly(A) polymerase
LPTLDSYAQRRFAMEVVEGLRARGFEAYWAGGCVRDQLLGRTPKDYDVATNARPEEIREVFGRKRTLPLGAAFGVITVLGPKPAGQIEVATFRRDMAYSDGRHPDAVAFTTPEGDAQRRDFTINGLFYDPLGERVIDFVDGQRDLQAGILRAIGDARQRFAEDKLRMLRGVRFAAVYGFELEPNTATAIAEMASEVTVVSVERIAAELRAMICGPQRVRAVELLRELNLLSVVLPEVTGGGRRAAGEPAVCWQRTLAALGRLEQPSLPLSLATLLAVYVDGGAAEAIAQRLKLPNAEIHRIAWLVENQSILVEARRQAWPKLQRVLISAGASELILLHEAMHDGAGQRETGGHRGSASVPADLDFCRLMRRQPEGVLNPPPLLTGDDLIRHKVPRGRIYQELLGAVRAAQLEERIHSRAEALDLVERSLAERGIGKE